MADLELIDNTVDNEENDIEAEKRRKRIERSRKRRQSSLPFGLSSPAGAAVILLVILTVCAAVVFNWDKISPASLSENSGKEGASAVIAGSSVYEKNFCKIDSGLIYISDTSIIQLNNDCEKVYSEKHSFTDPMIRASGEYVIAFGEGTGSYRIIHDKHRIHEGVQGNSITDCDINDSGTYCILSDQTGYMSSLSVYDRNNKFIYSYSFSDSYAVSVSLSRNGQMAAVGTINSDRGRMVSKVYLLDITKKDPIKILSYDDQIIYQVRAYTDDSFAVVTDMLTSVVKSDGSRETPYSYSSSILTAFDICYGNGISLSLSRSDDGRSCYIVDLDESGNETSTNSTDLKVTGIAALSDRTAVLSYGKLSVFSLYGDLLSEREMGTDSRSILMANSKTAYILGVSEITKASL